MVRVTSEVGRLRKVLVHEPGLEVDHMVPAMMDDLLFDDVLFGHRAREEHALFRRVLQLLGVETVDAQDALAEVLDDPVARAWVLNVLLKDLNPALRRRMQEAAGDELAEMLVAGVRAGASSPESEDLFEVPPIPNWCFQRDPQVVLADGVIFGAMAAPARHREALLARAVFRFHPELAAASVLHDPLKFSAEDALFLDVHRPCFEGGDFLVLSPDVVVIGHSERTNATATGALARNLAQLETGPRWMLLVEIPRRRAYLHLDTLITPVDRDAALVYPPVILPGRRETVAVAEVDLHAREPSPKDASDLMAALSRRGLDLEPIPCGGGDAVRQQREQWTDGANALALAPGVIALYDRNEGTAEELDRRGFRVIDAEDLLLGREEVDLDQGGRVCILLPSHEISRARGGPHCLTHPLVRDEA
jgi:arginine deiminase